MQQIKTYLTNTDIEAMIKVAPTLRDKVIIRLLSRLGCRVSELITIRTKDIDFANQRVTIQHLKQRIIKRKCPKCEAVVGRKSEFCPKCGNKLQEIESEPEIRRRPISLDSGTLEMIGEYLSKRRTNSNNLILLKRQTVYNIVRRAAEDVGLSGAIMFLPDGKGASNIGEGRHYVHPHSFRDAFAIRSLAADGSAEGQRHLQQHLGHKSFDTTARYLKYSPDEDKKWYDKIWSD